MGFLGLNSLEKMRFFGLIQDLIENRFDRLEVLNIGRIVKKRDNEWRTVIAEQMCVSTKIDLPILVSAGTKGIRMPVEMIRLKCGAFELDFPYEVGDDIIMFKLDRESKWYQFQNRPPKTNPDTSRPQRGDTRWFGIPLLDSSIKQIREKHPEDFKMTYKDFSLSSPKEGKSYIMETKKSKLGYDDNIATGGFSFENDKTSMKDILDKMVDVMDKISQEAEKSLANPIWIVNGGTPSGEITGGIATNPNTYVSKSPEIQQALQEIKKLLK